LKFKGGDGLRRLAWLLLVGALVLPVVAGAQGTAEKRYQIPLENSPSTGPADAPVTMFEFLDFQ
jgi:hypothetical protein